MWYHIVPTIYREKFFSFSHSIAFLWFIPLDIFSDSLIRCSMRGLDYLSLSPLIDIQWFQVFLLQMVSEYLGHMNEEFLESLYLDVEMLVIGYYISFFLLLQQITTNLAALNKVKFIVLGFWRSGFEMGLTAPKAVCQQGHPSSEALGEDPFACLFQLLEAACILWLLAFSSIINASRVISSNLSPTLSLPSARTFPLWPTLQPPSSKGLCDYLGSPR